MARGNFASVLAETLTHEGGYVNHPRDPGGATNLGITHWTLAAHRGVKSVTRAAVRALTVAEASAIYHKSYWNKTHCDELKAGVDMVTFDAAVNSGPRRSAKWLQVALGVPADGRIGPATLGAEDMKSAAATVKTAIAIRRRFLRGLSTWDAFGRGWTRRVNSVEARALAMVRKNPKTEKAVGTAGATAGAGAGGVSTEPQSVEQMTGVVSPDWLIWALVAVAIGAVLYFAWARRSRIAAAFGAVRDAIGDFEDALQAMKADGLSLAVAWRKIRDDIAAQAAKTIDDIEEAVT